MSMSKDDADADDDLTAFLNAVKDVKRIKPPNLAEHQTGWRRSAAETARHDDAVGNESGFVREGMQRSILRKLRNGEIPIESELDLHGCNLREAEERLKAFLQSARVMGRQCGVRVIHGRGLGSPQGRPVLKYFVAEHLRKTPYVLAFCFAPNADGGAGAVHVLLKKR